jgi:hypothetical protein
MIGEKKTGLIERKLLGNSIFSKLENSTKLTRLQGRLQSRVVQM